MDGTLGSQTARMLDGSGVEITSAEELEELIVLGAERARWPVAVHAIGDRANRDALDAFEATRDDWRAARSPPSHRARAVPGAGGRPALRGARHRGVRAVLARAVRPCADRAFLERIAPTARIGSARLWERGAVVANGSDAPVEELDPLAGIRSGLATGERPAEEAQTLEQALEATCVTPAWLR